MAGDPAPGDGGAPPAKGTVDLVIGKSTDKYYKWQQIPAWVLGGAAILGGAALIAFPKHQTTNAWAAVIVGLFLAAMLSYRSAFTLNDDSGGSDGSGAGGGSSGASSGAGANKQPEADKAPPRPDPPTQTAPKPGGTT